jgi:hypothetical protein
MTTVKPARSLRRSLGVRSRAFATARLHHRDTSHHQALQGDLISRQQGWHFSPNRVYRLFRDVLRNKTPRCRGQGKTALRWQSASACDREPVTFRGRACFRDSGS